MANRTCRAHTTVADTLLVIELLLTNGSIPLSDGLRTRFEAFRESLLQDESESEW